MPPKHARVAPPSYCVKCRTKTATGGGVHVQSGHRHMLKGRCETCGTGKTQFVGAGFFDDLWGGIKKVAKIAAPVLSVFHPKAGAALTGVNQLLDGGKIPATRSGLLKAIKKGGKRGSGIFDGMEVKDKVYGGTKRGRGLYRTSVAGSISRAGGGLMRAGKVGKGVLDDELTTDLHLKR